MAQLITSPLWAPGSGQGLRQFAELGLALVLSTLIGLEREVRQKSAGLRTHTLVGMGSALFMEVSKYGFGGLAFGGVSYDPSRVAAQIVSGIGFIGGGLIFVRRDAVRGLTTAATVWLTCAIGMACGGGLALLGTAATGAHFLIVRGYPLVTRRVSAISTGAVEIRLSYRIGIGVLQRVLELCAEAGYRVRDIEVTREPWRGEMRKTRVDRGRVEPEADFESARGDTAEVVLSLQGVGAVSQLLGRLADLEGVLSVAAGHEHDLAE